MTESVVFFCRHVVLNVLASSKLAIMVYIHYTTISVLFLFILFCIFQIIIIKRFYYPSFRGSLSRGYMSQGIIMETGSRLNFLKLHLCHWGHAYPHHCVYAHPMITFCICSCNMTY